LKNISVWCQIPHILEIGKIINFIILIIIKQIENTAKKKLKKNQNLHEKCQQTVLRHPEEEIKKEIIRIVHGVQKIQNKRIIDIHEALGCDIY